MKYQISNIKYQIHNWTLGIRYWILDIPRKGEDGQALVTLLFFMIMGITITTAAVIVILTDAAAASLTQQGIDAKYIAESGINEGLLHLLRNPTFTGNETFSVGDGSVTVQITSTSIIATGSAANVVRTVQAQTVYNNNIVTISSEKEL